MKKIVFVISAMFVILSCGISEKEASNLDSLQVDSVKIDSVLVDTVKTDSLGVNLFQTTVVVE